MPANRMKAAVGSTLNVIGRSSAMVSAGPSPGRTPIAVPSVVPTRHHMRYCGVRATAKPFINWESASISSSQQVFDEAGADVDAQRLREAEVGNQRQNEADRRVAKHTSASEPVRDQHEHDRGCGGEAEGL